MCIHERPKKFRRGGSPNPPPPHMDRKAFHMEKKVAIILPHGEN